MADPLVSSLTSEEVIRSNPLGTVTNSWLILRPVRGDAHVIVALHAITEMKMIRTTHPGLLVIAGGLLLIAAGAYFSHSQAAALCIAVVATFFLTAYQISQRGSVIFASGLETVESGLGSIRDARDVIATIATAQNDSDNRTQTPPKAEIAVKIHPLEIKTVDGDILSTPN